MKPFKSIIEFQKLFGTDEACRLYLEEQRWGNTPACPHCGSINVCRFANGSGLFKCREKVCRKKFSVTVGTVYQDRKLPLHKIFLAVYVLSVHSKGISSRQLANLLDISQKAAWLLNHKVRNMLTEKDPEVLSGIVEVDECFIGGKNKNKHKSKRVLFVCSSNKDRSPALQKHFEQIYPNHQFRSAGVNKFFCNKHGSHYLSLDDIAWAQFIVYVESVIASVAASKFTNELRSKPSACLNLGEYEATEDAPDMNYLLRAEEFLSTALTEQKPPIIIPNMHYWVRYLPANSEVWQKLLITQKEHSLWGEGRGHNGVFNPEFYEVHPVVSELDASAFARTWLIENGHNNLFTEPLARLFGQMCKDMPPANLNLAIGSKVIGRKNGYEVLGLIVSIGKMNDKDTFIIKTGKNPAKKKAGEMHPEGYKMMEEGGVYEKDCFYYDFYRHQIFRHT